MRETETEWKKNGKEEKSVAYIQCHIQPTAKSLWYFYKKIIKTDQRRT